MWAWSKSASWSGGEHPAAQPHNYIVIYIVQRMPWRAGPAML
jgi:hypothetical protein